MAFGGSSSVCLFPLSSRPFSSQPAHLSPPIFAPPPPHVAKNAALAGISSIGLLDPTPARVSDRGSHFYLTDEHLSKGCSRAEASLAELSTLNPYVRVSLVSETCVTPALASSYTVIVLADVPSRAEQLRVSALARASGAKLVIASAAGAMFGVFVDAGPTHTVSDPDGNPPFRGLLSHVTNASPAVVTVSDEQRHGLSDGMFVTFEEVDGMPELSGLPPTPVTVISPYSFSIPVDTTSYGVFSGVRGYFNQVKLPLTVTSLPFSEALAAPVFANDDFTGSVQEAHALFSALGAFADGALAVDGAAPASAATSAPESGSPVPASSPAASHAAGNPLSAPLPSPTSVSDAIAVASAAFASLKASDPTPAPSDAALRARLLALARPAGAQVSPVASAAGGVVGQEVVKLCTGKFLPISQFYYYSDYAMLPPLPGVPAPVAASDSSAAAAAAGCANSSSVSDPAVPSVLSPSGFTVPAAGDSAWACFAPAGDRYDDYMALLSAPVHARVRAQRLFLVGAGAIGCEMLKTWALMGAGCAADGGSITVTDMDTIEKSNLNRQFLFRSSHVGQLKSATAARAAMAMNPALSITAQALKVGKESEDIYTDVFWNNLSGVYTALDNVEARLYVDGRCVYFKKPLVDSGTLGTKGNTQVVVPYLTESYGSTRDPPEESIPLCTLKNFPHKIEHTVQWARDVFEGDFTQAPGDVNSYLTAPGYVKGLLREPNSALATIKGVYDNLVAKRPLTFDDCIVWARGRFEIEFNHNIRQLLVTFPADAKTSEGAPFWSGTKRPPQPLAFDPEDPTHVGFVLAAANLRAFNYKLHGQADAARVKAVLASYTPPPFEAQTIKIATTDAEAKEMAAAATAAAAGAGGLEADVAAVAAKLPSPPSMAGFRLNPVEFEKDDDTNHHIDYITACSNLRARCYRIQEASAHETKRIAGKIIPAIATTTALVTGLVCVEMCKLLQNKPLAAYRSSFANLADNVLVASEPFPPATQTTTFPNGEEWTWSLWDAVEVCVDGGRDITLAELVDWLKQRYSVNVSMLNYGEVMVYLDFGMGLKKNVQERLPMTISAVAAQAAKAPLPEGTRFVLFGASLTDEDDVDIDVPSVRVQILPDSA